MLIKRAFITIVLIIFAFSICGSAKIEISDFFSDFTSSDVTIISDENINGKAVFELFYAENLVESHEVAFNLKANKPLSKVILWEKKPQYDYYTAKISIFNETSLINSKTYQVSYGTIALPSFHVIDFSPTNNGAQMLIRPFNPSAADIEIQILENNDVVYSKIREDVSLITNLELKTNWPFTLKNNKKYTVRAKIFTHRLYASPLINTYIAYFTANDDVEILANDVEVDEYGASVTVLGKSQVPFDGNIIVNVRNRETNEIQEYKTQLEEILVFGREDTAGIVWDGLSSGIYDVEIIAINKDNVVIDKYETVFRIPELPQISETQTPETSGFTLFMAVIIIIIVAISNRQKGGKNV